MLKEFVLKIIYFPVNSNDTDYYLEKKSKKKPGLIPGLVNPVLNLRVDYYEG